jgi:hypothetical protein
MAHRVALSLAASALTGAIALHFYPFPADHVVLALIRLERPALYAALAYTYTALWFSSSFFLASIGVSCLYIFVGRRGTMRASATLPPYPAPERRLELFVVLGERHHRTSPDRAAVPTWLSIPERGLYTGLLVVGAIGSGKTSACMYHVLVDLEQGDVPIERLMQQDHELHQVRARLLPEGLLAAPEQARHSTWQCHRPTRRRRDRCAVGCSGTGSRG